MNSKTLVSLFMIVNFLFPISIVNANKIILENNSNVEWYKTYGDSGSENAYHAYQLKDGDYIIVGFKTFSGDDNCDLLVIKTDSAGKQKWLKTYGGNDNDMAIRIQETLDGNYIIFANINSKESTASNAWLIKIDKNGNKIWDKTYGNGEINSISDGWLTKDRGYILIGTKTDFGNSDIWVFKTNSNGVIEWEKNFDKSNYDAGISIYQTSDNGFIILGTYSKISYTNLWLIKLTSNGQKTNEITYGNVFLGSMCIGQSICQTNDGGYIIAGYRNYALNLFNLDFCLWKFKTNLQNEWEKIISSSNAKEMLNCVRQTTDGGYILVGNNLDTKDIKIFKTTSNGNQEWSTTFGGNKEDMGFTVEITSDYGYIVAGLTLSYGAGNGDALLIKLKSDNLPPNKPNKPSGKTTGGYGVDYSYSTKTTDSDGDQISYLFDWGDGTDSGWLGPYPSGTTITAKHTWKEQGSFDVKVKAKDGHGAESEWSDTLPVIMPKNRFHMYNDIKDIAQIFKIFFLYFLLIGQNK